MMDPDSPPPIYELNGRLLRPSPRIVLGILQHMGLTMMTADFLVLVALCSGCRTLQIPCTSSALNRLKWSGPLQSVDGVRRTR